jgi:hypothetical protein
MQSPLFSVYLIKSLYCHLFGFYNAKKILEKLKRNTSYHGTLRYNLLGKLQVDITRPLVNKHAIYYYYYCHYYYRYY